jgi:hypothetical protein
VLEVWVEGVQLVVVAMQYLYEAALLLAAQESAVFTATTVALFAGPDLLKAPGGATIVVNDQ